MKKCKKGISCGATCIASDEECRKLLGPNGTNVSNELSMLVGLATEFQQSGNLDENTTAAAISHDAVHGVTGLGPTLEDERIVLNITNALVGDEVDDAVADRVANIISFIPPNLMIELSNLIERSK